MKKSNLSWTNGRDVHYPIHEPNLAHVESLGQGKLIPIFKPVQRVGAKIVPHRMPS